MLNSLPDSVLVAGIGLFGGILLGLAARLGRFCTLGAIEDQLYGDDDTRLRMWGIALGTAIIGSFALFGLGLLDPSQVVYLAVDWNPLASIFGGLLFGYGMALAGNCGFGALARLGGGDLRSFVIVLVMGLSAYVTLSGPLAGLRVMVFPTPVAADPQGIAHFLARLSGVAPLGFGLAIGLLLLALAAAPRRIHRASGPAFWSIVVGLAIVSGWAGTSWVAERSFGAIALASHSFAAPIGETLLYAMIASGSSISFGVGSVSGVVIGAAIGSAFRGHFRWEACDDPRELKRQILGAALMGPGAVIALGCSVGQGLSAFSVLSFGAPVTLLSIYAGAAIGLRQLITGFRTI